jgi:signal transduction histidine kinase
LRPTLPAPFSGATSRSKRSAGDQASQAEGRAEALRRRLMRLALDVHDGPMQNLAVIGFSLGDLRRRMQTLVPAEHQTNFDAGMEQISAELGRVESDLRALIGALEQGAAHSVPLREAIESEIVEFQSRCSVLVDFQYDTNARAETDSQRIALQSVARAALANVAKHAHAEHVTVRLTGTVDTVTLEIEDDGRGFRPAVAAKSGRLGLAGMRHRVELLGGDFSVASRPGGPSRIVATLQTWRPQPQRA